MKQVLSFSIVIAAFFLTACSSGPEDVANDFADMYLSMAFDDQSLPSESELQEYNTDQVIKALKVAETVTKVNLAGAEKGQFQVVDRKISTVAESDDSAKVTYMIKVKHPQGAMDQSLQVAMKLIDGDWKVVDFE